MPTDRCYGDGRVTPTYRVDRQNILDTSVGCDGDKPRLRLESVLDPIGNLSPARLFSHILRWIRGIHCPIMPLADFPISSGTIWEAFQHSSHGWPPQYRHADWYCSSTADRPHECGAMGAPFTSTCGFKCHLSSDRYSSF